MKFIFALLLMFSSGAQAALPITLPVPLPITLPTATTTNYNLYLSPTGLDTNSGLSPVTPLKTLAGAQAVLKKTLPAQNVVINVAPGTYYDQTVVWTFVRPNYLLTIKGMGMTKPVFDGCPVGTPCTQKTFFALTGTNGQPTNIVIDRLQIQRYWMAISLNGNWLNFGSYNWNNVISNNIFKDIGNGYAPNLPYSYTAVRLYNSRNNQVTGNTFSNIINAGSYGAYMHAVYAASYASSNTITYNSFENVSGDVIRFRDNSNFNLIANNNFSKAGKYAAASDWYCTGTDCAKLECPSWNNTFSTNIYGLNYSLQSMKAFAFSGSNTRTGCAAPDATSTRMKTDLNVFMLL